MILTKAGSILGPIATVLGYIMDILFRFTDIFGIFNVGLCIILFTIVMKMIHKPTYDQAAEDYEAHVCDEP